MGIAPRPQHVSACWDATSPAGSACCCTRRMHMLWRLPDMACDALPWWPDQVSGESVEDYRQSVREGLRRLLDAPVDALLDAPDWVVAYVRPATVDPLSKGPAKVWGPAKLLTANTSSLCCRLVVPG